MHLRVHQGKVETLTETGLPEVKAFLVEGEIPVAGFMPNQSRLCLNASWI